MAKLIEATIAVIGDKGFQRATVQEISGRAGLSVGVIRQFDSRPDLIVRTAEEVFSRQLAGYRILMEHIGA
ncbi:TetR family transcriptional regulator [Nocardia sp. NPDC004604]|uniref:TetR family transcriptional regulator n=1 Tax=Nocardia sp. NPDC004604 TaxID=3157013 RepID=UPI0033B51DB5